VRQPTEPCTEPCIFLSQDVSPGSKTQQTLLQRCHTRHLQAESWPLVPLPQWGMSTPISQRRLQHPQDSHASMSTGVCSLLSCCCSRGTTAAACGGCHTLPPGSRTCWTGCTPLTLQAYIQAHRCSGLSATIDQGILSTAFATTMPAWCDHLG
jgi:hypothetical protein